MKEDIWNIKNKDEITENSSDIRENSGNAQIKKKTHFFVYIKWLKLLKKHGEK